MNKEIQTREQLFDSIIDDNSNGVYPIKPRVFLEALEQRESPSNRELSLVFPPVSIGSPSIFEVSIISLLAKLLGPRKIVEIGTYTGYTTAILARNAPDNASIISIDLPSGDYLKEFNTPSNDALLSNWEANDSFLRQRQSDIGEIYLKNLPCIYSKKIELIKADSTRLPPADIARLEDADLFFIDGGHSFDTVKSDTSIAFSSISSSGIILWHDYGSDIHSEVTRYIDNTLSCEHRILHIRGTSLALLINGHSSIMRLLG